jgi:preprotein translocase subunit SecF
MQLFKNTNFDFLGKKTPFIVASLVLTVAGFASLAMKGGPRYGIDFKGGALMYLRFNQEPPVQKKAKCKARYRSSRLPGNPKFWLGPRSGMKRN